MLNADMVISRLFGVRSAPWDSLLSMAGRHAAGLGDQRRPRIARGAALPVEHRPEPPAAAAAPGTKP